MREPNAEDVTAFLEVVYDNAEIVDPENRLDWFDLAFGFLLARGVDPNEVSYTLLVALSCGDEPKAFHEVKK